MTPPVARPKLAELMIQAALDMYEFGRVAVEKGGYFPRVEQVAYKENDHGWPSVTRSLLGFGGKSTLIEWTSVFGIEKNQTLKFDVNDVPALAPLVEEAISDQALDRAFDPFGAGRRDPDKLRRWVGGGAVTEAATLLMRAEALGDVSEATLRTVYGEWERGHFEDEVSGDLLFPILLMRFDIDDRIEIAPGVSIERISEETHRMRALSVGYGEVNAFLAAAATHALVLHDRDFDNSDGPLARRVRFDQGVTGQEVADLFFQALTVASGQESGYAQICLRPHGWATEWTLDLPPLERVSSLVAYPQSFTGGWNTDGVTVDATALAKLPALFASLRSTTQRAQLAARRLRQSSMREYNDDIVIDACIGIEALVGEEHDELVHRMGLRASVALSQHGWNAAAAYNVLKKVYGHRSKIVHGTEPKNATIRIEDTEFEVGSTAVFLLRQLLEAHLLSSPPWSPASLDADLFDAIGTRKQPDA
nr:HEPN domain-containing protein [uncultured Microbacterium sp.]